MPPTPCRKPGCHSYAVKFGRCKEHQEAGWSKDRGSSTQRGYGAEWRKLRKVVMSRDLWTCQECLRQGIVRAGGEVDHIVPKSRGGSDSLDNLELLCTPCHKAKTTQEALQGRMGWV